MLSLVNFFSKGNKFYCGTVSNSYFNPDSSNEYSQGKYLFQNKCASCHILSKDATGPALIGFTNRGPWADKRKIVSYLNDPVNFYKKNKSKYIDELYQYSPVVHLNFEVTEKDVDDFIYYVESEGKFQKRIIP